MLSITIELADADALRAAIVSRAAELLVTRLAPEALRRMEAAVDKAVTGLCGARIEAAVEAVLREGFSVRDEWGHDTGERVLLVEVIRRYLGAQMDGRGTRLERLVWRVVEEALTGGLGETIREANERARTLLDRAAMQRLARELREVWGEKW